MRPAPDARSARTTVRLGDVEAMAANAAEPSPRAGLHPGRGRPPTVTPAVASASPSNKPIRTIEKPILLRYMGIIGYNISLAISVKRLTKDKIQTVRVMTFNGSFSMMNNGMQCITF